MRVCCTRVFKIMKTLSCPVARNNDLLREEETIGQLIHTNEAYAHICIRACAYMHTRICIRVYAYWADANYAYILVRIHLSCTVRDKINSKLPVAKSSKESVHCHSSLAFINLTYNSHAKSRVIWGVKMNLSSE